MGHISNAAVDRAHGARRRSASLLAGLAIVATLGAAPPRADAGLAVTERFSSIRANGTAGSESYNETTQTSDPTAAFDESVSGDVSADDDGSARARGSAAQRSAVESLPSVDSFRASGRHRAFADLEGTGVGEIPPGEGIVQSASLFRLEFTVSDEPEPFHVRARLAASAQNLSNVRMSLLNSSNELIFFEDNRGAARKDVFEAGFLQPDTYTLDFFAGASAVVDGETQAAEIDYEFVAGPAAIPLPPAVLSGGLGLLTAAAAAGWSRRRRHGAA
jgi:hypothetical protein